MSEDPVDHASEANAYDRMAEKYNWRGPDLALGLAFEFIAPGESVLDLGIGTGLSSALFHSYGLRVYGMDATGAMLEQCRRKGFAADLQQHDLTNAPYPYDAASMDHAVCLGVLDFFKDVGPIFKEVSRILRDRGVFVFALSDRGPGEGPEYAAPTGDARSNATVTMYRRSLEEMIDLLEDSGFELLKNVAFSVFMDPEGATIWPMRAYVARRKRT